ncbi:hypothetical protein E4J89_18410 [Arthrobacter sp. CAU 1506]|uniref:hypothetical protein n=1 Tax=Arthrobacter sp. CAU 1506 TaxID=2560052 RepID=UPI0010AB64F7|nr:hypothetical protein [Arthrobacter sp. CAU 1506]TJY64127.1 hypothetical protein E4J89_18410 [Arthrobacter sp. CAU 1506]
MDALTPSSIITRGLDILRRAGVRTSAGNLERMSLAARNLPVFEASIKVTIQPPTPSRILTDLSTTQRVRLIYFTNKPGAAVTEAAEAGLVDLVALEPATVIIGREYLKREPDKRRNERVNKHRKNAWGRWAVERVLILSRQPMGQTDIAPLAGISQPAVSNAFQHLQGHIVRRPHGWEPEDRAALLDKWLDEYPGPGGASTYWYGLDAPVRQARDAAEYAESMEGEPLISGDVAADTYAPWRLPNRVQLYVKQSVDLTDAGFTPADPDSATLVATIPADTTLWTVARMAGRPDGHPLADPLITLWDLMRSPGPDAEEASQRLRAAILGGSL